MADERVSTEVAGEVREYHFRCDNKCIYEGQEQHEFSVLTKGAWPIDKQPLCFERDCSATGVLIGDNQAEVENQKGGADDGDEEEL